MATLIQEKEGEELKEDVGNKDAKWKAVTILLSIIASIVTALVSLKLGLFQ